MRQYVLWLKGHSIPRKRSRIFIFCAAATVESGVKNSRLFLRLEIWPSTQPLMLWSCRFGIKNSCKSWIQARIKNFEWVGPLRIFWHHTPNCYRGVQRGEMRGSYLTYISATPFSPTVSATPKILSATPEFEVPQTCGMIDYCMIVHWIIFLFHSSDL